MSTEKLHFQMEMFGPGPLSQQNRSSAKKCKTLGLPRTRAAPPAARHIAKRLRSPSTAPMRPPQCLPMTATCGPPGPTPGGFGPASHLRVAASAGAGIRSRICSISANALAYSKALPQTATAISSQQCSRSQPHLPAHPPHGGVVEQHSLDRCLKDIYDVVVPANMSQLMRKDRHDLCLTETGERRHRQKNVGPKPANRSGNPDCRRRTQSDRGGNAQPPFQASDYVLQFSACGACSPLQFPARPSSRLRRARKAAVPRLTKCTRPIRRFRRAGALEAGT